MDEVKEIISTLICYNHDVEFFKTLADIIEQTDGNINMPQLHLDTELHTIYEMLVILFGDWGTSVRSGWIEDNKGCAKFIRECIEDSGKSEVF